MDGKKFSGPKKIGDLLGMVLAKYNAVGTTARIDLERAWRTAAGPELAEQAKVGALRRGTLEILVPSSALLHELEGFRKRELLEAVQTHVLHSRVTALRFRKGA